MQKRRMDDKANILVVDDDLIIRLHFAEVLRAQGYEVWEAGDGAEALAVVREKRPDLVLLDVLMPGENGFEVCRKIKEDKELADVFVVIVSGKSTDETPESWGLGAGADDYIAKPVRSHEFLARVKFILRLRDTTVALRAALELNEAMMSGSSVGITAYRASGRCVFANLAAARITGVAIEELRKSNFRDLDWWRQSGLLDMALETLRTRRVQRDEIKVHWEPGKEAWLSCHLDSFSSGGEPHLLCFTEEITERKRMEEELRDFPKRIMAAQEAERHRVARDLHDSVNQMLASVKMRLRKVAEESAASLSPANREILSRCGRLLAQALEENRRIAYNLRPGDLDELGLSAASKSLCDQLASRTNLKVTCGITESKKRYPADFELNLFRILQEALNNIEKHAAASSVWVRLSFQSGSIALTVVDDGKGFVLGETKAPQFHGIGLANIRERAEALGAKCEIVSALGSGTSVNLLVPEPVSATVRSLRKRAQDRPVSTQQTA